MPEPHEIGRTIAHCAHLGRLCTDQALRRAGYNVTPVQTRALNFLARCGREVNQRDLERELDLKPSTVNGIVSRLEEKGYLVRQASPDDRRCRLVSLTERGRSKVGEFRAAVVEIDDLFTDALSPEEQAQLQALLERVVRILENEVNAT